MKKKKVRKPMVRVAKKNRKRGEIDEAINNFDKQIDEIDATALPPKQLLSSNPEEYRRIYYKGIYRDQIRKACASAMAFIGAEKKSSLSHANNLTSDFRATLENKLAPNDLLMHEIRNLQNEFPEYAANLRDLEKKSRTEIAIEVNTLKNSQIPDQLAIKLSDLPVQHLAFGYLRMTKAQREKYSRMVRKIEVDRHQNPITIDGNKTIHISIDLVKNRKTAPVRGLACAVCNLIGRREIEVLKKSKFEKSKIRNHIRFSNKAKSKDKSPIDIPVIGVTPAEILDAIRIIRKQKDFSELSNTQVNQRESKYLNEFVRTHYANEDLNVKYLRYLYTAYADKFFYEKYGAPKKLTKIVYLASILAHELGDLRSQINYGALVADWKPFTKAQQKKLKIERENLQDKKTALRKKANEARLKQRDKEMQPLNKKSCQFIFDKVHPLRQSFIDQKTGMSAVSHAKAFDYVLDSLKKGELPTKSDIEANGSNRAIVNEFILHVANAMPEPLRPWPKKIHQVYPFVEEGKTT